MQMWSASCSSRQLITCGCSAFARAGIGLPSETPSSFAIPAWDRESKVGAKQLHVVPIDLSRREGVAKREHERSRDAAHWFATYDAVTIKRAGRVHGFVGRIAEHRVPA